VNITDADRMEVEEPSWMCCLFTVLALGFSEEDLDVNDLFSPREFFSHAKRLASMAVEDESIQSIQALLLMVSPKINSTHTQESLSLKYRYSKSRVGVLRQCYPSCSTTGSAQK